MKARDVKGLKMENLFKDPKGRVTGVRMNYAYKNGEKTDEADGYAVELIAEANGFKPQVVKVSEIDFDMEAINNLINSTSEPVYVTFVDFSASIYFNKFSNADEVSAKAKKAILVKSAPKQA